MTNKNLQILEEVQEHINPIIHAMEAINPLSFGEEQRELLISASKALQDFTVKLDRFHYQLQR
jgi:hypothetical protein